MRNLGCSSAEERRPVKPNVAGSSPAISASLVNSCVECRDQGVIWMLAEEWPCPFCRAHEYEEKMIEQRIDLGELAS